MLSSGLSAKTGLGVTIVSFIFQLLGYLCPGWVLVKVNLSVLSVNSGLSVIGFGEVASESAVWFVRLCVLGDPFSECSTDASHNAWDMGFYLSSALSDLQEISWIHVQILLTLALFSCAVVIATSIIHLCDMVSANDKVFYAISAASSLLSGTFVLPPVLNVGIATENTKSAVKTLASSTGSDLIAVDLPYALMFSAIGLTLAFIASVLFIIAIVKTKSEKLSSSVYPTSFLSPAILKIGNFPAHISMSDRMGHVPPTLPSSQLPAVGSKDEELLAFEHVDLDGGQGFEPYVLFTTSGEHPKGLLWPPDKIEAEHSDPPPFRSLGLDSEGKRLAGSLALSREHGNNENGKATLKADTSPKSPRNKVVKLRKVSGDDVVNSPGSTLQNDEENVNESHGKNHLKVNQVSPTLIQREVKGKTVSNKSPSSPRKTVRVSRVHEDQLTKNGKLMNKGKGKSRKDKEHTTSFITSSRVKGSAIGKTNFNRRHKDQQQSIHGKVLPKSPSSKMVPPTDMGSVTDTSRKSITISKVPEDDFLIKQSDNEKKSGPLSEDHVV